MPQMEEISMKLQKLNCPNCDASLNIELTQKSDYIFCPYCGQQFYIENEKREFTFNKNINYTKRKIDQTEIEKARISAKETKFLLIFWLPHLFCGLDGWDCLA